MSYIIKAYNIQQNKQGFLLGIFKMGELSKFVRYSQRIVIEFNEDNKPEYNSDVQRKISPTKVDGIADFLIHDADSFFPTNIVLAIPTAAIEQIEENDGSSVNIVLKDFVLAENQKQDGDTYITIIDGQHRIAGIEKAIKRLLDEIRNLEISVRTSVETSSYEVELKQKHELLNRLYNFEIIATFFIDPTLDYQAMIFSTINRTQTRVSEDLVYSLFGLSKEDSPQKTSLEVAIALNASDKSPFYNRIKVAGARYNKGLPPLSQAMMVKSILYSISPNLKQAEIEKNKTREYVKNKTGGTFLPFRKYYGEGRDEIIAIIISAYFRAVKEAFKNNENQSFWDLQTSTNILQTTVGYQGLFLILIEILRNSNEEERVSKEYYYELLLKAKDVDFEDPGEKKLFPFTSKSINILYNQIGEKIFGSNFEPKKVKE